MKFHLLELPGSYWIELDLKRDERGFFARSFCENEFAAHGLDTKFPQCNLSFNRKKGTLRGMHFSSFPFAETKLVRCTKGAIFDVIIDLRIDSPTYLKWVSIELSEKNRILLYIPKGCAHGFQTLENHTEVFYQMSTLYSSDHARGIRWNDPYFNILWPLKNPILSLKDQQFADFFTNGVIYESS